MAESKKVQLYTDRECTIEAFPETSARYVTLSDGLDLESVLKHDLTAPTVTHEEISFKVGKGDIDVSSSIVDGEPSKVVIKGKTYQNILPEPSLRNSMKNGKSMQKFNTGYDSVNVVDGVVKSAILSGKTLVNLLPSLDKFAYNGTNTSINTAENSFKLVQDGTAEHVQSLLSNLVINKTYILIYEVTESTLQTDSFVIVNTPEPNAVIKLPRTIGVNRVKFTQRVLTSNNHVFRFAISSLEAQNGNYINVKNPMLIEYQEGMENWDIPYFAGMTSVKMPVLSSIGKNLFDGELELGAINEADGKISINENCVRSKNYQRVIPNTSYALSNDKGYQSNVYCYTKDKTYISPIGLVNYKFTAPENCYYVKFRSSAGLVQNDLSVKFQLEQGTSATTYEPHKSNILSLSEEVVLRSLPSGVYDTYNIVTKEYVQRIKEVAVTFDATSVSDTLISNAYSYVISPVDKELNMETGFLCDKVPKLIYYGNDGTCGMYENKMNFVIWDKNVTSKQEFANKYSGLKLQYKLATPVIKTVDLSSFGNWEKVVLNGSENWWMADGENRYVTNLSLVGAIEQSQVGIICNDLPTLTFQQIYKTDNIGVAVYGQNKTIGVRVKGVTTLDGFKQYLSQSPITVWYPTVTSQANSIKEMLSFANGHIQLASGVDNSLIPSIDYEVPTSNSYHLDLAKVSTKYTMKNMSGTFTVDGTQYNASANGTFTTASMMTNKLMVTSAIQSNSMLLEGDVTSKTLSYFKGIKSAFEDKDKIEVLSTGKNLFDAHMAQHNLTISSTGQESVNTNYVSSDFIRVVENTNYYIQGLTVVIGYDVNSKSLGYIRNLSMGGVFTTPKGCNYIRLRNFEQLPTLESQKEIINRTQLEESPAPTTYEPFKSNDVKIPLLKPSRSILGGVYDEIILDRENNKAKVIQRVGKIILNGGQEYIYESAYQRFYTPLNTLKKQKYYISSLLSDKGEILNHYTGLLDDYTGAIGITGYPDSANNYPNSNWLYFKVKNITTISELKQYLSLNPITVYYELATPIVTEVDIEGFPYIYKDGHIFLNSEIAPQVEVTYISNQTQQIKANNETLIRHEIDIDSLEGLIAGFIEADYQLRLFQFDYDMLKSEKETTI